LKGCIHGTEFLVIYTVVWAGHVADTKKTRNAYRILAGQFPGPWKTKKGMKQWYWLCCWGEGDILWDREKLSSK